MHITRKFWFLDFPGEFGSLNLEFSYCQRQSYRCAGSFEHRRGPPYDYQRSYYKTLNGIFDNETWFRNVTESSFEKKNNEKWRRIYLKFRAQLSFGAFYARQIWSFNTHMQYSVYHPWINELSIFYKFVKHLKQLSFSYVSFSWMSQAIYEKVWEQCVGKKNNWEKNKFYRWKRKTLITWLNPIWESNISWILVGMIHWHFQQVHLHTIYKKQFCFPMKMWWWDVFKDIPFTEIEN